MGILVWPKRLTNFLKPKPNYGLSSYLAELRKFSNSTFNYALHFTKMDNFEYTFGSHLLFGLETQDSMRGDACLSISCPPVFSLSQPRPYTIRFPPPTCRWVGRSRIARKRSDFVLVTDRPMDWATDQQSKFQNRGSATKNFITSWMNIESLSFYYCADV